MSMPRTGSDLGRQDLADQAKSDAGRARNPAHHEDADVATGASAMTETGFLLDDPKAHVDTPASSPVTTEPHSAPSADTRSYLRRAAIQDADVPSVGFRRFLLRLWLLGLYGSDNHPPRPSRREQIQIDLERARQMEAARKSAIEKGIALLASPRRMVVDGEELEWLGLTGKFAFVNAKSAGKTTTALITANETARITHQPTLVLPLTANPGDGAMRSGASPKDTITSSQLLDMLPDLKSGKITSVMLKKMIQHNAYGVYIVAPDFRNEPNETLQERYMELVDELSKHFPFIFMDGGNSLNGPEMGAVLKADQVVFTAFTGTVSTRHMLGETMDRYASDPALLAMQRVEKSIVVVSGLRDGEDITDFERYAHTTYYVDPDGAETPRSRRRFDGSLFGIRWDDAIAKHMVPQMGGLSSATRLDYLELLFQMLYDSAASQGIDLNVLRRILVAEATATANVPFVEDMHQTK